MSNPLGVAAHQLDTDGATLQTDIATYLAAGGSAHDLAIWLNKLLEQADPNNTKALLSAVRRYKVEGSIPGNQKTLVAWTPGAVYP